MTHFGEMQLPGSALKNEQNFLKVPFVYTFESSQLAGIPLPWSICAAARKNHRLGVFNNRHLFLTFLEAGNSKIKLSADLVPTESTSWFVDSCLFTVLPWQTERANPLLLPIRRHPMVESPTLMISSKPN